MNTVTAYNSYKTSEISQADSQLCLRKHFLILSVFLLQYWHIRTPRVCVFHVYYLARVCGNEQLDSQFINLEVDLGSTSPEYPKCLYAWKTLNNSSWVFKKFLNCGKLYVT